MSAPFEVSPNGTMATDDDYGVPGEPSWLEIDWRRHLRVTQIEGTRVNYVDIGEGDPIVFIHGLSGCWQNWLENLPFFAQRHRVIALDLPGFGESELPLERISIPGYGRFIDAVLGEIGVDHAALVGNSMGGYIAAEVAITQPARVAKLVLVSAAGLHELPRTTPDRLLRLASLMRPLTLTTLKYSEALVRRPRGRRLLLNFVALYPQRLAPQICVEILKGSNKPGFSDALRSVLEYDFRDRVPQISCPTLIIWGRNDIVVPVRSASEYERLIPNARKIIFERTGHVPMLERAQRFNQLVDEFLAAPTSAAKSPKSRESAAASE